MSECPACSAGLVYESHSDVAPSAIEELYRCPDPDCEVVTIRMVVVE